MKIVILTEGGGNIGFGHLARCSSLASAFSDGEVKFLVHGDDSAEKFLTGKECQICDWWQDRRRLSQLLEDADCAVVDSYLAPKEIYDEIADRVKVGVYLDDDKRIKYPRGIVLNAAFAASDLGYEQEAGVSYLFGPEYALLRPEFKSVQKKMISRQLNQIFLSLGGADEHNLTPMILQTLTDKFPDVQKAVIVGALFRNEEEIERSADPMTKLVFAPDAQGMRAVMENSDAAISSGGQTLIELAHLGVPTVSVQTAENQLPNVSGLVDSGFLLDAGGWSEQNLAEKIMESLAVLRSADEREKRSKIGQQLIDGQGPIRVKDKIVELIGEGF